MSSERRPRRAWELVLPLSTLAALGCGEPMVLGSDLLWSSDHESGDLSAWSLELRGGSSVGAVEGSAIEVTSERAKSGGYSVKLTTPAAGSHGGPLLFRELALPNAYYSTWYNLPAVHQTLSYWTILQIRTVPPDDEDESPHGVDVNLRALPNGQVALFVFDNTNGQEPLAYPPALVPIDRWFHLEVAFEGGSGHLSVWLEGRRVYDLETGVRVAGQTGYYMPCNVARQLDPSSAVLFVDDAAISATRVGPDGVLDSE